MKKSILFIALFFICSGRINAQSDNNQITVSVDLYTNSSTSEEIVMLINNLPTSTYILNIFIYTTDSRLIYQEKSDYYVLWGNTYSFTFHSINGVSLFSDGWIVDVYYSINGRIHIKKVMKPANTFTTGPLTEISDTIYGDPDEGSGDKGKLAIENSDGVTIYYNYISDNKELEVVSGDNNYNGNVNIPEEVSYNNKSLKVTSIGKESFRNCSDLLSVTIPNSITSIGEMAFFGCSSLSSIAIPNSVTTIGEKAFMDCGSLTSVTLPNNLTNIEYGIFARCGSLSSVVIPNSVTNIGGAAFYGCRLNSVSIPNSVTSIGGDAFQNCSLSSIIVEKDNERYDSRDDCNAIIESETNTLIIGCNNTTIPTSVTRIGGNAFNGCSGLTSLDIPNSVTKINGNAFEGCGLTYIEIPSSITTIEGGTFINCSSLTSLSIPNSVTSIGDYAFEDCSSLKSVIIPNSVTSLGEVIFNRCSNLTSVTLSNSLTSISRTFLYCSSLESITLPNSITSIGDYTFYECNNLKSVTLGENISSIGQEAFATCYSLKDVYCYAENVPMADYNSFNSSYINTNTTLHVPANAIQRYEAGYPWYDFKSIVALSANDPNPTGIRSLMCDEKTSIVKTFSLDGKELSQPKHGLNIIRTSDRTIKKVLMK